MSSHLRHALSATTLSTAMQRVPRIWRPAIGAASGISKNKLFGKLFGRPSSAPIDATHVASAAASTLSAGCWHAFGQGQLPEARPQAPSGVRMQRTLHHVVSRACTTAMTAVLLKSTAASSLASLPQSLESPTLLWRHTGAAHGPGAGHLPC